jgi:hypothetical protein
MSSQVGWYIIEVLTVVLLVADGYFYADKVPGNTWSQIIIARSKQHIWLPFVCGCLMGHWFL